MGDRPLRLQSTCVIVGDYEVCEMAAQLILIAEDLAEDQSACEQIEYGARMAVNLRTLFWDKMLDRATSFPAASSAKNENISIVGYQKSL